MRLKPDITPLVEPRIAESDPLPPEDRKPAHSSNWLDRLYRAQRSRLLRFASKEGTPARAQDIVQQLFLRLAARTEDAPLAIEEPEAYLRRSARNLIRDEARAATRASAHLHVCADEVTLASHDPVAALEARDMLQRLEQAVARLEPRTREIFLAHRIDGFTYSQIAARTGLSVKTVEKHMSRAIAYIARHVRP